MSANKVCRNVLCCVKMHDQELAHLCNPSGLGTIVSMLQTVLCRHGHFGLYFAHLSRNCALGMQQEFNGDGFAVCLHSFS